MEVLRRYDDVDRTVDCCVRLFALLARNPACVAALTAAGVGGQMVDRASAVRATSIRASAREVCARLGEPVAKTWPDASPATAPDDTVPR